MLPAVVGYYRPRYASAKIKVKVKICTLRHYNVMVKDDLERERSRSTPILPCSTARRPA
jgi:hypothetical protein